MNRIGCFLVLLIGLCACSGLASDEELTKVKPKNIPVVTPQPEENKVYPVAVIGAGAGGTMAAKRAVLNNQETLLFTGAKKELKNSRGNWVRKVENIPGLEKYSRTIVELRNEMLTTITAGPFSDKLFVIPDSVTAIEKQEDLFRLTDSQGHTYLVQYVILATGMMDEQPHIQGSIEPILKHANHQQINYCLLCDGHRSIGKKTVVIGYQEDAGKAAVILYDRYHPTTITIVTNGKAPEFSPETDAALQERNIAIMQEPIQEVLYNEEAKQFLGFQLPDGQIEAEIGFVLLGIRPNNALATMLGAELDERGLVKTDQDGETCIPNLFVVGDLRADSMKQIYTAWQHAVDAVQIIDRRIRTTPKSQ